MKLLRYCWLLLIFMAPTSLWAACTSTLPGGGPIIYTVAGFNPPPFNPNVANGTVLYTQTISSLTLGPPGVTTTCDGGGWGVMWERGIGSQGAYHTYPTSIPGVGLLLANRIPDYIFPYSLDYTGNTTKPFSQGVPLILELIKTGPITSAGQLTGEIGGWYAQGGASQVVSFQLDAPVPVNPQVPACTVTTLNQNVSLGSVSAGSFTTIGSVSAATPFNIQLQCSGGSVGTSTNVYMTMTDPVNPSNTSNILPLSTATSTASGVGIQLLNGSTVLSFGPDSSAAHNTNQWLVQGSVGNGILNIPLSARYIQTATTVTPGEADGVATFTMSYQ